MSKTVSGNNHRHSIYCILPPYILDRIALNGTPEQRRVALRTGAADVTFRALRQADTRFAPGRTPTALAVAAQKTRSIYTAKGTQTTPGTLIRAEGQAACGDVAADEAYDALGATFDFYNQIFSRNSIDDAGMPLTATVHFGQKYNNAFWNSQQMVFGDGDGDIFNRFTASLDVIGHELTHGVTEDETQLQYFSQSGALNESMSDVFGSLIKQFVLRQTADQADWLIGAGLFTARVKGVALRSMKDPGTAFNDPVLGKDPQPKHMSKFVQTFSDNGGVHINSGIPNHAFYQVATRLGGHAWEKAGLIWYTTLCSQQVKQSASFRQFAAVTVRIANQLYGATSTESQAVKDGWAAVGVEV